MRIAIATVGLVCFHPVTAQTTVPIRVDARMVDPNGVPLAKVTLADRWRLVDGVWQWSFECPDRQHQLELISDDGGRVRGTWTLSPFETPLLAWSADHRLALFVGPSFDPTTHEGVVAGDLCLQPATTVRADVRSGAAAPGCRFGLSWTRHDAGGNTRPMHCWFELDRRHVEIALPPGGYELRVGVGFGTAAARTVVLEAGRREFDLGSITVPACAFDLPGELLPDWHVDRSRGLAIEDATLAHFRGKPLLVNFADYGHPSLDPADRGRLEALATHPQRARFGVVLFGGAPLPPPSADPDPGRVPPSLPTAFPLFSDDTGATERLFGSAWGAIVVDADGRLLMHGSLRDAVARLEALLAQSPGEAAERAK